MNISSERVVTVSCIAPEIDPCAKFPEVHERKERVQTEVNLARGETRARFRADEGDDLLRALKQLEQLVERGG